jgi:hypothetical protein
MKVINATFGQAVKMPKTNKIENFVNSDHAKLEWDDSLSALVITQEGCDKKVLVFPTNISHLTFEKEKKAKA